MFTNRTALCRDAVRTRCEICLAPVFVSRMREHTKKVHNVHISDYKQQRGLGSDRDFQLVETVLHQCGECGHFLLLDR